MRINHNIAALNTYRQFNNANNAQSKSMEKLSSGLRINSAADDAAGLAISEKMRGQIRGLDQAGQNAQDGISLIQTAEGALNETHDILQRMRELSVQSSNDTATDSDRKEIQKEVSQLKDEVDRISNTTEFNQKKLLNGSVGNNAVISDDNLSLGGAKVVDGNLKADTYTATATNAATVGADVKTNTTGLDASSDFTLTSTNVVGLELGDYTLELKSTGVADTFDVSLKNSDGVEVASAAGFDTTAGGSLTGTTPDGTATKFTIGGVATGVAKEGSMDFNLNATYASAGDLAIEGTSGNTEFSSGAGLKITDNEFKAGSFELNMTVDSALIGGGETSTITTTNNALTMHIGANANQTMKVDINKIDTNSLSLNNIDLTTQKGAEAAITKISKAIENVSGERSKLGAYQNRLDHTINNLNTSSENITAAESRIRDVDYALAA
ncbi:flagellin [Priestia megaterium]|uniref:Flagellin n=1 Tax=Priestia megaterium TaxID=1404 RepID=A0AAX6BFS6_PRIMG|nr:flagellin [Priestia megaterium]QFY71990.1 flagellin [Priestia megaterium]GMG72602.1 flagellin [Priestia megaterium]